MNDGEFYVMFFMAFIFFFITKQTHINNFLGKKSLQVATITQAIPLLYSTICTSASYTKKNRVRRGVTGHKYTVYFCISFRIGVQFQL